MSSLGKRLEALEHIGTKAEPTLILVCRSARADDEIIGFGECDRLPGESVEALKDRISTRRCAGLVVLIARYRDDGLGP
jgi:hypothetical protein